MQGQTFINCHYIRCLRAQFAGKLAKAPLLPIARLKMEPGFGSWQSPDILCSHLYRRTIAYTPPTAIFREYNLLMVGQSCINVNVNDIAIVKHLTTHEVS